MDLKWKGPFTDEEVNRLHAEAFQHRLHDVTWNELTRKHSLGWVTARRDGELAGFANVIWDGLVHAWIQDVMVRSGVRRGGVGAAIVAMARQEAAAAGCEWLHVDFDEGLEPFYFDACGFRPTPAGLIRLDE